MCVLTYVPIQDKGFILTANRDESPERKEAVFPESHSIGNHTLMYPKDTEKGGTWIAASSSGIIICLLNGAFKPHQSNPPYRKSRGLVVLETFDYPDLESFSAQFEFQGIEPFTMVYLNDSMHEPIIQELRWTGEKLYQYSRSPYKPQIWCSASLYSEKAGQGRASFFHEWLNDNLSYDPDSLFQLHQFLKMGEFEEDYLTDGNLHPVKTLSTTQVIKDQAKKHLRHHDLTGNNKQEKILT